MELIPSIDLLGGSVVRLQRGDFAAVTDYGDPRGIVSRLDVAEGSRLHIVDLEASRRGEPVEMEIVRSLAGRDLRVQVGGGVRSLASARTWFDCGAERIVVGTAAAETPELLRALVDEFGTERIVPAVDVRDGVVRVAGWERAAAEPLAAVLERLEMLGIKEILATDIGRDGILRGPSFALYRQLRSMTGMRVIASGGVAAVSDLVSLARMPNVSGCVIGKALLEQRIDLREAAARVQTANAIPVRVIPCLDVRDGRVVKGVNFASLRDSGDPVECAQRYEAEGADEIVILDVSATDANRQTALDTVRRAADALFIPLTVGGGIRTIDDFRAALRAGADRVAINTAAVRNPQIISECAREFGVQAVVLSCDVKDGKVFVRSGREAVHLDAIEWCRNAEALGAGEILLTSIERDGTNSGFDLDLLRAVTSAVNVSVIASGGAGSLEHFRDAVESGGARAVLAASLFHDRRLAIGDVKDFLAREGIPVR
jgi:cyclase